MVELKIQEQTQTLLNDPLFGEVDLDTKIRQLLESEFLQRLGRYRRMDLQLAQKYAMDFEQFIASHVTKQKAHSWEAEKDAMDWETAIGGIQTMKRKLAKLRTLADG